MFEIDKNENDILKLPTSTFSELGFGERTHLQEWLAKTPSALGEELLIIQKEFAGFSETKERFDLLALDKKGELVIIENKLDDTGQVVVWQALRYVAYCSTLTKTQIIEIFQDYLQKQNSAEDAGKLICDFLDGDKPIDEVILNSGSNQRCMLVAGNFRKEVTSTVLWLIAKGVNIQCIKVTPYAFNDKFLLDINQIIPTPEAEDYMIDMSKKQGEENKTRKGERKSQRLRFEFWTKLLENFREREFKLYHNINPTRDNSLDAGSGFNECPYTLVFNKNEARVEFRMGTSSQMRNTEIFDFLVTKKSDIENIFGHALQWQLIDDYKLSIICYSKPFDGHDPENWEEIIEWLFENMKKLEEAIKPHLSDIPKQ